MFSSDMGIHNVFQKLDSRLQQGAMMETVKALAVFLSALFVGCLLFYCALWLYKRLSRRNIDIDRIFKGFRQKMWMTVGLGLVFFGAYLLLVWILGTIKNPEIHWPLFSLLYRYPMEFVYLGLLFFAVVTMSIYLVRMVIKYLYNKKYPR